MSLIKCTDVTLSYENRIVVHDLTFEVNEGDFLCIVGENGSGKSTLVKALLSLKNISGGKIEFGDGLKKNEIGYLPQQTSAQKDFPASVWEVVLSGCLNKSRTHPFYSPEQKQRASANINKLGLSGLEKQGYRELSGGQQQRVLLARALCAAEKILFLDEPTAGLDPNVTEEFYNLIKQINKDGMTIVMVSHDTARAIECATHILHLHNTPLFLGKKEDYKNNHAYMGNFTP